MSSSNLELFLKKLISVIALASLAGCATNSGIVDLGGGNYVYEKEDMTAYNGSATKVEILKEAAAFCSKQGKQMIVQSSSAKPYTIGSSYAGAEVQFACK
ncbi:hypothetical protein [Delftia tsuruhatensis]|jgi:hypothetical protein|uniref:hypothetical protein n=1 Tax=Delftia tsuruhatensis TaxID=180282 RepID=UPI0012D23F4F|nr:hypothetical protein [Delftia tsuruhatensis]MPT06041.1 hypothetical protein [Delftia sp.]